MPAVGSMPLLGVDYRSGRREGRTASSSVNQSVPVILDRASGGQAGDGERETPGFPEGK